jgi:hypothetical protein
MYLPPGNIDELLNAPDYVPPVLRGRQIAKLIGQGVATSAEIYKAQETIAALEQELRDEAQRYDDNLVPVFNVGHTAGYNQGHKAGWKEAVAGNREYGFKLGYVEAAKDLISGDNFILIDKKDPAKPIRAESTERLVPKIPLDDPRYAGLRNEKLRDRKKGELMNVYAKDSSWISAGDDILFLDIAKTRKYAQERGRITGKKIFINRAGQLDWKPDTSDFPKILNSVLKPAPPVKYTPPNSKEVRERGEKKFIEYKKVKK